MEPMHRALIKHNNNNNYVWLLTEGGIIHGAFNSLFDSILYLRYLNDNSVFDWDRLDMCDDKSEGLFIINNASYKVKKIKVIDSKAMMLDVMLEAADAGISDY